jgi:hypothetical protein
MTPLAEWNARLAERAAEVGRDGALCGADLVEGPVEGAELRALVKEQLVARAQPSEIGLAFVAAIADAAYEVDWTDHFRFWPLLDEQLETHGAFSPGRELAIATRNAFARFTDGYGGVRAAGRFADAFPYMSWPLFHAVLPRSAQRHVARLLERATREGFSLRDEGRGLATLSAVMGAPVFVQGLLGHERLSPRLTGLLVSGDAGGSRGVRRRILDDLREDEEARELLARARARSRAPRAARIPARTALPLVLVEIGPGEARLCVEIGPLVGAPEAVRDVAASGGTLMVASRRAGLSSETLDAARVLASPAVTPLLGARMGDEGYLRARANEGSLDPSVSEWLERCVVRVARGELLVESPPGEFRALAGVEVEHGRRVAILDTAGGRAPAEGFTRASIDSTPGLEAWLGVARPELLPSGVALAARGSLRPVLVAPARVEPGRLTYAPRDDAWLSLEGAAEPPSSARLRDAEIPIVQTAGRALIHVPCGMLTETPGVVSVLGAEGGLLANIELQEGEATERVEEVRWRAHVEPPGATIDTLLAGSLWLRAWAAPGATLALTLEAGGHVVETLVDDSSLASPLAGGRLLRRMGRRLCGCIGGTLDAARLYARATDEPAASRLIANLEQVPRDATLVLIEQGGGLVAVGVEDESLVTVEALRVTAAGLERTPISPGGSLPNEDQVLVAHCGDALATLVWAPGRTRPERWPVPRTVRRGRAYSGELVALLRALDRATLAPHTSARALLLRHTAMSALERALVSALCGPNWAAGEDQGLTSLVPLIHAPREDLDGWLEGGTDPFELLGEIWERMEAAELALGEIELGRHLLLILQNRAAAPVGQDAAAVAWASEDATRARLVRLASLACPAGAEDESDEEHHGEVDAAVEGAGG